MDPVPRLDAPQQTPPLTRETVFSLLSNERRRQTLRHLWESPESDIGELSRELAAWENDVPVNQITYKQRKRVYTSLRQSHLPKLDDAGVVDYDRDRGTVVLTSEASVLEAYLDGKGVSEADVNWSTVYLAVAVVGTGLTLLTAGGLLPAGVSGTVVAGSIAGAVAVVAAVHRNRERVDERTEATPPNGRR